MVRGHTSKMKITRAEVDALFLPGNVASIQYIKHDLTSDIIGEAEGNLDGATHALCCMGGLDIVEATALGVFETNLHNYLRGNCILTVREAVPTPSQEAAELAIRFWDKRVLDPYDWGMIFGTLPVVIIHHVLGFFSKRLADIVIRKMPNLLASNVVSTCAELGARGLLEFNTHVFPGWNIKGINPEILRTDPSLRTKAVLVAPVLEA